MNYSKILKHEFVEYIPNDLKDGTIYVSIIFATVVHKCCCGCGNEVVTPLSPTDWKLIFDGKSISLHPSIGNWNFDCQSHYWIKNNRVRWALRWSQERINTGRGRDALAKERYFNNAEGSLSDDEITNISGTRKGKLNESIWWKVRNWFFGAPSEL